MTFELGFDIGGTFTDFALLNTESGELQIFKTLTTAEWPEVGAMDGIATFLAQCGSGYDELLNVFHGTTLVANTLIEHKGALVGLLTTAGFRDILEMRTEQRYAIYDLFLQYPPPLSPRHLRRGIRERVDRDGNILERVCEEDVRSGGGSLSSGKASKRSRSLACIPIATRRTSSASPSWSDHAGLDIPADPVLRVTSRRKSANTKGHQRQLPMPIPCP